MMMKKKNMKIDDNMIIMMMITEKTYLIKVYKTITSRSREIILHDKLPTVILNSVIITISSPLLSMWMESIYRYHMTYRASKTTK